MPSNRRLRWSLVTPVVVVAGLFGMHGLGDHDSAHASMTSMTSLSSMATTLDAHAVELTDAVTAPPSDDGMAGMAMGLCVAILLGGLLAAYVAAVGRRTPWSLPRLARVDPPLPRGRAPDPPAPALLSVYRC